MPKAFVGETRLPKNFKRYTKQFSLLELDCEPGSVPGKARLQSCAAVAPPGFIFSLILPSTLASLEEGPEAERIMKAAKGVARVLRAQWWVVRTPPEVRPTRRVREGLAALTARLKEDGMRVAWEPRGVWDETAAGETADTIGAVLVQDIAREAPRPAPVLYSRLLALGRGARVGLSLADTVVERLRGYDEAFVVVEGQGAKEIQQALGLAPELDETLDEDDLDDDDLDDDEETLADDDGALDDESLDEEDDALDDSDEKS
jgi:uncharacterized protein YecE (DUF72 family)